MLAVSVSGFGRRRLRAVPDRRSVVHSPEPIPAAAACDRRSQNAPLTPDWCVQLDEDCPDDGTGLKIAWKAAPPALQFFDYTTPAN